MQYFYTVDDPKFDDYLFIEEHTFQDDIGWIAEQCAKDYWDEHDGWDYNPDTWSNGIDFYIWTVSGKGEDQQHHLMGKYSVIMELTPSFHAYS